MHAGEAMALLLSRVNKYTIRMVGWWNIGFIICYLHTSAHIFTEGMAAHMVQHGDYDIIPPAHEG